MQPVMSLNKELHGIELTFTGIPSESIRTRMKEQGFRYHRGRKIWYAKETDERMAFAKSLCGQDREPPQSAEKIKETVSQPQPDKQSCFADYYDRIGNSKIYNSSDLPLGEVSDAYFRDLNIYFRRFLGGDSFQVIDLTEAGEKGKDCTFYSINSNVFSEKESTLQILSSSPDTGTVSGFYKYLKENMVPDDRIEVSSRKVKGIEVFSPFASVEPLKKIPEKWNKQSFTKALLSGQIFQGQMKQELSEDYALDAARDFGRDTPLDIPAVARDMVEDWCRSTLLTDKGMQKDGSYRIDYYDGINKTQTFRFDLNGNLEKAKIWEDQRREGVRQFNQMMEHSCISLNAEDIDPAKVYHIITLDRFTNSGVFSSKEEKLPGYKLQARLESDLGSTDLLSAKVLEVQPELFYMVADCFHKNTKTFDDDRIIHCGNWRQIVTGKALMEMVEERLHIPEIKDAPKEIESFEKLNEELKNLNNRKPLSPMKDRWDYENSLQTLEREQRRAAASIVRPLDKMISSAKLRAENQLQNTLERPTKHFER